ncbi:MAG: xanthine dehydrogenase family protein subunit M [Alphaproteobacteria bacterium]|nr:xanthine dehydrogenase family protein subunit M [Alphaproteobacteria bacterium]
MAAAPKLIRPASLDAALRARAKGPVAVLAGGTDFFPMQMDLATGPVLDISRLPGLGEIADQGDHWRIGAALTWAGLAKAELPPAFDGLKSAGAEIGSVQIQNSATLVGNICNASPAADGVPALLVLEAEIEVASTARTRLVPLEAFISGVRKIALAPDELVTAIVIPKAASIGHSVFQKIGSRRYLVISIASVAVRLVLKDSGEIQVVRIAVGSCSPVACRLRDLEEALIGHHISQARDIIRAGDFTPLSPISDLRATASYRLEVAREIWSRAGFMCEGRRRSWLSARSLR